MNYTNIHSLRHTPPFFSYRPEVDRHLHDIQTVRQTVTQPYRQTGTQTYRQTGRQTVTQTYRQAEVDRH